MQSPEQIRDWLGRARLFSMPSVEADSGDSEGFGIVFLEAQSMGVPVVSFRHGGIPEAVADGVTGLLSDERDWRGLAANLTALHKDEARWQRMSTAARQRTVEQFDLSRQTRVLETFYEEVVAHSEAASSERVRTHERQRRARLNVRHTDPPAPKMRTFCMAEDRAEDTSLRLALLSLRAQCPDRAADPLSSRGQR